VRQVRMGTSPVVVSQAGIAFVGQSRGSCHISFLRMPRSSCSMKLT
jgi:hypothetical protein